MISKFYAIKDESAVKKGTIISTLFALIVAGGCYFLGGFGRLYAGEILMKDGVPASFDAIIPAMLKKVESEWDVGGTVLIALVLILVLAASMSTLSSLVMTSSSTVTLDLIVPLSKKKMGEKKQMIIMRVLIGLAIVSAAAIAILVVQNQALAKTLRISALMGISWGALAGCFLAPFLYGLFWKKVTAPAVWVSFATGLGIMLAEFVLTSVLGITFENAFMKYFFNNPINAGMLAMVVGLVEVPVVSLLTRKQAPADVDEMFACYNKEVTVSVKTSLEE